MEREKGRVRRRWEWERVALAKDKVRGWSGMYYVEGGIERPLGWKSLGLGIGWYWK